MGAFLSRVPLLLILSMAVFILMEGCGSSSEPGGDPSTLSANDEGGRAPAVNDHLLSIQATANLRSVEVLFAGKFGVIMSDQDLSTKSVTVELSQGAHKTIVQFPITKNADGLFGFNIDENEAAEVSTTLDSLDPNIEISFRLLFGDIEISKGSFFADPAE